MKVGYFQTAFLGDLLLSVPALRWIKREHPEGHLTLFCRKGLGPFMENLPFVDQAIEVDKGDGDSRKRFSNEISRLALDILFCPHQSLRTHKWVWGLKSSQKIGFARWWNAFFFSHRVPRSLQLHDALRQLSLIETLCPSVKHFLGPFLQEGKLDIPVPELASMTMPKEFWQSVPGALDLPSTPFVVLAPGSVWNTKRWTLEGFLGVAKYYKAKGLEVVFMGSPAERSLCEELAKSSGGKSIAGALSLWDVTRYLSEAQLLVCNDSGAQHMASLAGTPTVSVFGPTVGSLGYRPWNNGARVVEEEGLACRPCGKHGHERCPIGTHECMTKIAAQRVIDMSEKIRYGH